MQQTLFPPTFENRVGKHHRDAGPTEKQAAVAITPKTGTARRRIYEALVAAGRRGLTAWELVDITGLLRSTVDGRLNELADRHFAVKTTDKRLTARTGMNGAVWRVLEQVASREGVL